MAKKDTYIPRNELVDMNKEFDMVREKAEKELMKLPGVIAVGVGLKDVKGEFQRELCFKVTVQKKKGKSELKPGERIPETINGFKTDVNEVIVGEALVDHSKYRPLIGGSQIQGKKQSNHGTLGCFATRNSDNKIVLLSNWHVIVGNPNNIDGDRVGQPNHNGCCSCCACGEIADVVDGRFLTGDLDAAIALLHGQDSDTIPEEGYLNEIIDIGILAGSAAPVPGETLSLRGRTTSTRSKGQISHSNVPLTVRYKNFDNLPVTRAGQFVVSPSAGFNDFSVKGDSGSVCVNEHNQAVLLVYGNDFTNHFSLACNIQTVEATLNIKIPNTNFANVTGKEGVPLNSIGHSNTIFNLANEMEELEAELMQFREGKRLLELFKIHRPELLGLINHKREVMAAWNRYQGPAYLAHIARSFRRENKPVPEQIKSITLQSLLLKMTAVLQRNGSPELARSVTENYLQVMNMLSAGRSLENWKAYLVQLDEMIPA